MTDEFITGYQIYHGFLSGYFSISKHREHLNSINVFPVPDGDTGSNMVRTFKAIARGMVSDKSVSGVMNRIADLSLEGARGNSGMILSQFINAMARQLDERHLVTVAAFGDAVRESVDSAYQAMDQPREGTMLTVISDWASEIYDGSRRNLPFADLFSRAFQTAQKAVTRTPQQLKVLRDNGVVDAGALGVVSFLEGIELIRTRGFISFRERKKMNREELGKFIYHTPDQHYVHQKISYRYCTEVLLDQPTVSEETVKKKLRNKGDSLIVSKGRDRCRVHIHSNEPHEVVRLMSRYGKIVQQKADDMVRQEQLNDVVKGRVGVLTDSIADIPLEIMDRYEIHVINLKLSWDDDEYLDRLTITPEEFYTQQGIRKSFPGSSVPDRAMLNNLLQSLMDHYDSLIVLPVARSLSGTWQQIVHAAEPYNHEKQRIRVIDTCLNSAAQGLLVVEIAKAATEGRDLEDLGRMAESLKKRIRIYVSVNTFKYMVKGGRVSPLTGFIAGLLHLKPIVSLDEKGKGTAFEKAFSGRGLRKKITGILKKTFDEKGIERFAVVHAANEAGARRFAGLVESITACEADYITSISPVVGMHSGKGAVAIGLIEGEGSH